MKKLMALGMTTAVLTTGIFASGIGVYVNGNKINAEAYLDKSNNRTLVPIRFVADNLGADTKWDAVTKTAKVTKDNKVIEICIPCKKVTVDGQEISADSFGSLRNSRTYVPLRLIAENFNAEVAYKKGNVYISTNGQKIKFEKDYEWFTDEEDSGRNYKIPTEGMKQLDKSIIPDSSKGSDILKNNDVFKLYDGAGIDWNVRLMELASEEVTTKGFGIVYTRGNGKAFVAVTTDGEWITLDMGDGSSAIAKGNHLGKTIDKVLFSNGTNYFLVDIPNIEIVKKFKRG